VKVNLTVGAFRWESKPVSVDLSALKVDDRIRFDGERQAYTVQARSDNFIICTKPFNPQRTVIYSIIDIARNIRGPDNMVFSNGYETREQCEARLAELVAGEIEVSWRRRATLEVNEVLPAKAAKPLNKSSLAVQKHID
jgi:hypothetical protein